MAPADSGQRRGPPKARKDRPAATKPLPEEDTIEEGEWYEDVVDEAVPTDAGFGGFAVKRPRMGQTDLAEGEQWERYFDKQYHRKSGKKREAIEEDWVEAGPGFDLRSLFAGHRILTLGVQSMMIAMPMLLMSGAMMWGANSTLKGMDGSTGLAVHLVLVLLAVCLTTIGLMQVVVHAVNLAIRNRSIALDGPDISLLGWAGTFQLSSRLFSEMILTFCLVWAIALAGLYLLMGGIPDLGLPMIDPDHISAGAILYLMGAAGSAVAMLGVIPYAIQATIERT
jgi:hypothetical protein